RCRCRAGRCRGQSWIVQGWARRYDSAQPGDDLRAFDLQRAAVEIAFVVLPRRGGVVAEAADAFFGLLVAHIGVDAERPEPVAGARVEAAALLVPGAAGIAERGFHRGVILAPVLGRDLDVADDQKLHRQHRQQRLLAVRLAVHRAVADDALLLADEVPIL